MGEEQEDAEKDKRAKEIGGKLILRTKPLVEILKQ